MTLAELNTLLTSIEGFTSKVAYYAFPEGSAPALPFICYLETGSDNFSADNVVYHATKKIDVELYTKKKDPTTEAKVETALTNAGIFYKKNCYYIETEKCFQIVYEIEV